MEKTALFEPISKPSAGFQFSSNPKAANGLDFFVKGDILLARHFFVSIETDFEKMFSRMLKRLEWYDKQLGNDQIFQMPFQEAKKINQRREELNSDLRLLLAHQDYLEWLTNFHIQSLDAVCQKFQIHLARLESENQQLKTDLLESYYLDFAKTDLVIWIGEKFIISPKTTYHERF